MIVLIHHSAALITTPTYWILQIDAALCMVAAAQITDIRIYTLHDWYDDAI